MSRVVLVLNVADEPSETFQRSLAVGLAEGGHDVVVYALREDVPPDGVLHPRVTYARSVPMPRDAAGFVRGLGRHPGDGAAALRRATARWGRTRRAAVAAIGAAGLLQQAPDLVHVGFSGIAAGLIDGLELLPDVPLIVSCRGTDELVRPRHDPDRRARLRRVFARASLVHCVAGAVADATIDLGADPRTIRVVRPAVDLERWAPAARPAPGPPWRIVTTTRLVPAKGVDDLVAALAVVVESGIDASLEVLGGGPQMEDLRLRAERAGVDGRIELAGTIPNDEVRRRVRSAHLYVSPSLSEGISNGVLEAMAAGVPVLSTDVGGMAEVIVHAQHGWLVAPGRPDRLASSILDALGDADELAAVGARGRARIVADHGLADQAIAWRGIYAELLGTEPGAMDRERTRPGEHPGT